MVVFAHVFKPRIYVYTFSSDKFSSEHVDPTHVLDAFYPFDVCLM